MSFIRDIIDALFKELKSVLREYVHETTTALKKRLQKLLITGIIISILLALVISLLGSAVLFLTIGQLKYLSTFMPAWMAWDIMGLTSGAVRRTSPFGALHYNKKAIESKPKLRIRMRGISIAKWAVKFPFVIHFGLYNVGIGYVAWIIGLNIIIFLNICSSISFWQKNHL